MLTRFITLYILLSIFSIANGANKTQEDASVKESPASKLVNFIYFTTQLPEQSQKDEGLYDLRGISYLTPERDYMYNVCFFELEEDFDQLERLKEESAEFHNTDDRPLALTVGEGEMPLLFYSTDMEGTTIFTGVFADYTNNVGIFINCIDKRDINLSDKMLLWSQFRRPTPRKVDVPDWITAAIELRQQIEYGSLSCDHRTDLTYQKIGHIEIKLPTGLNKEQIGESLGSLTSYKFENNDGTITVFVMPETLGENPSPVTELIEMSNMFKQNLFYMGAGICEHANSSVVYYTGNVLNETKVAFASIINEKHNELINVTIIDKTGSRISVENCWAIARSIKLAE